jgi:multidrug resistance protein MdtO
MGLLIVLRVGTAMAAWLSTGAKRNSYAGWQMGLALFMTIIREAHPVTELDVIWDRFVGIVLGVIAMRLAFAFSGIVSHPESSALRDR